jgi:hypothetical protein
VAVVLLAPYLPRNLVAHGEIYGIISGVVEARSAILEGQFPLRVLPWQNGGIRYPFLQFYGNLPLTVGGLISLAPETNPYTAWKWLMFLALVCGGWYACRTARLLTRRPVVSMAAGLVFLAAPYLLTDLYARGAVAETVALCLLPAALFYTVRCFRSRRRGWESALAAAVAWTAVALTHNITYLYGATFVGLFVLTYATPTRASAQRALRLAAAGALHALLVLWYFVPQWHVVKDLNISGTLGASPQWSSFLTPLAVLLSPVCTTPYGSSTPQLGLQVGWPILLAGVLASVLVLNFTRRNRYRGVMARLLALFIVALFMAWSPVDFWRYLPRPFHYVQFSYRLLGYVALFGALLSACVLAALVPRRLSRRAACAVAAGVVAALALPAAGYFPTYERHPRGAHRWILARPLMGGRTDYQIASATSARTSLTHPDVDLAGEEFGLVENGRVTERAVATVAVPKGATALRVRGALPGTRTGAAAPRGPMTLTVAVGDGTTGGPIGADPFDLTLLLTAGDVGRQTLTVAIAVAPESGPPAQVDIDSVRWIGAEPSEVRLLAAREVRPLMHYGRRTWCDVTLPRRTLLVLPVIYYPGLQRVHLNGESVPCRNVGRFIALELPRGQHRVEVWFTGVGWANVAGVAGLSILIIAAVVLVAQRRSTP